MKLGAILLEQTLGAGAARLEKKARRMGMAFGRVKAGGEEISAAAAEFGLLPDRCLLVASSEAAVGEGCVAGFGAVVAIADEEAGRVLMSRGADRVFADLSTLDPESVFAEVVADSEAGHRTPSYYHFAPDEEPLREVLTAVGNGYIGCRGAMVTERAHDDVHYPGTYIAGLYNRATTDVHGRSIENNDFVNCPNWLLTEFTLDGIEPLTPRRGALSAYHHSLNTREAISRRSMRVRSPSGRTAELETERFVHMRHRRLALLRVRFRSVDFSGTLSVRSAVDGTVINYGVKRYRGLTALHLEPVEERRGDDTDLLTMKTTGGGTRVSVACRTRLEFTTRGSERSALEEGWSPEGDDGQTAGFVARSIELEVSPGDEIVLEKVAAFATDNDSQGRDPADLALASVAHLPDFDSLRESHIAAWRELWDSARMRVAGDRFSARVLNLHAYHLLSAHGPHHADLDVGITARGLHGEAYRGHIFWDAMYTAPFYNAVLPSVTRAHLLYRYRRLDVARRLAREEGYEGAMYPWQSADDGREESQVIHYNPRSGSWDPDLSRHQRHVSIAVAYTLDRYLETTGDTDFLDNYGYEMLFEIARFWASRAILDEGGGRYHIDGVMGPNEFHEKYPDAPPDRGGFRDNAYTNMGASWLLFDAATRYGDMPDVLRRRVCARISLDEGEVEQWREVASRLSVVVGEDGLISQFDGWQDLAELDWDAYRSRYADIHRLDRILKAENDSPNRYKISKQADVLNIFYLFPPARVQTILREMGYNGRPGVQTLERNYEYYLRRTSHGSTLSYVVHSLILRYLVDSDEAMRRRMWDFFETALKSDLYDIQGGTTAEGIHCGVMAGTIQIAIEGFAGVGYEAGRICIDPHLPDRWQEIGFSRRFAGRLIRFSVNRTAVTLRLESAAGPPIPVLCAGREFELEGRDPLTIPIGEAVSRRSSVVE